MVPGQAKQFTHQAGGNVGFVWVYVGFVWVCIENTAASVERDVGKTRGVSFGGVSFQFGRDDDDDDDVYHYVRWRLKLEGETENMGVCTKS